MHPYFPESYIHRPFVVTSYASLLPSVIRSYPFHQYKEGNGALTPLPSYTSAITLGQRLLPSHHLPTSPRQFNVPTRKLPSHSKPDVLPQPLFTNSLNRRDVERHVPPPRRSSHDPPGPAMRREIRRMHHALENHQRNQNGTMILKPVHRIIVLPVRPEPLIHQLSPNPPKSRVISSGAWVKDAARWRCRYDADAGAF